MALFAYPLFVICIIPIPIIAYVSKVEWLPIARSSSRSIKDLEEVGKSKVVEK